MRSVVTLLLCGLVVGGLTVSAVQAEEKVDNPQYKHWAQFKVGSFAELKTESTVSGTKTVMSLTTTLKEIKPDHIILEIKGSSVVGEQKTDMPVQKTTVPAKIDKEMASKIDPPKKGDNLDGAEVLDVKQGEEEIKVGDKKIKTKWVETKLKLQETTTTTKAWTSEEVPGQIVKMATTMEGPMKMTTEGSVVKYKAEKADGKDAKADKKDEKKPDDKKDKSEPAKKDDTKGKVEKSDKPEKTDKK